MRNTTEKPIKSVIEDLMETYQIKGKMLEVGVINAWREVMGISVAKQTNQIYLRDGKLFIQLDSSVLKQELSYAKEKMKEVLNRKLKKNTIEEIILL